jgi:hypothetical protein
MKDTTNHRNSKSSINMCIDAMQDPPPAFKNPKSILNANSTNIHLLVERDFK